MKRILLFTVFLLLKSTSVFSQDWTPISLGDKFIYKTVQPQSSYLSFPPFEGTNDPVSKVHTAWIDSITVVNGDSIFYFNKIVNAPDIYPPILTIDEPIFLQHQMLKSNIDDAYLFQDSIGNEVFRINHKALLNEPWIFDISNNINATVIQTDAIDVFGMIDSVKTIALSSSDTFQLSKNYGLLSFPFSENENAISLIGVEGKNVGLQMPKFDDYFQFNIGDIFQFKKERSYPQSDPNFNDPDFSTSMIKKEVTGKVISGDVITYEFDVLSLTENYKYIGGYLELDELISANSTTSESIDRTHNFANLYAQELAAPYLSSDLEPIFDIGQITENTRDNLDIFVNDNNEFTKMVIGENGMAGLCPDGSYNCPDGILLNMTMRYDERLGLVDYTWSGFESGSLKYALQGAVLGQDTIGSVSPHIELMVSNENVLLEEIDFSISPNPANDLLEINFSKNLTLDTQIEIYNNLGQLIFSKKINQGQQRESIKVNQFDSGIYFLQIKNNEWRRIKKVIIKK